MLHLTRIIFTLGVFVVSIGFAPVESDDSKARQSMEHQKDRSITCYECNSQNDPRCGDPFDPYTIGTVNCSMKRPLDHINLKPTLCRKTTQIVQGHKRVIRSCGYIQDERDDKQCARRSGTHDVTVFYCSCRSSLCNGGHGQTPSTRIVVLMGAFVIIGLFQSVV